MNKGILIKDLAKELGVTANTVINWEKRGRVPKAKLLIRKLSETISEARSFF